MNSPSIIETDVEPDSLNVISVFESLKKESSDFSFKIESLEKKFKFIFRSILTLKN